MSRLCVSMSNTLKPAGRMAARVRREYWSPCLGYPRLENRIAFAACLSAFAHGDQDNPPKWDKLQQWYITFFVSVLNALTYVSCSILDTLCDNPPAGGAPRASCRQPPASPRIPCLLRSHHALRLAVRARLRHRSRLPGSALRVLGPTTRLRRLVVPPLHLQLPLALAPNIGTIILCRFLAGRAGVDGAVGGKGGGGGGSEVYSVTRYQTYSALALAGAPPVREPDVAAAGLRVGVGSTVLLHGMSDAAAESAGS
ncbi:uncharacterized protein AFUA_2G17640 [Aspergillus fumigatus Af293]|uniref:Uncharacterized protein n=1 Tax=Aspergillus fumigatus (strain ATCC MYA-4609 / CBS 101355 / FGSC A1100 / Af293) TaxID=330879 RepID=Q4WZA4_ASPFU|nr:conserved hypothetical protein [Aspergillus fumigatus Af293]EAL94061.1 conserved hypothetical protein [Aspergillus fumigatus Af293]